MVPLTPRIARRRGSGWYPQRLATRRLSPRVRADPKGGERRSEALTRAPSVIGSGSSTQAPPSPRSTRRAAQVVELRSLAIRAGKLTGRRAMARKWAGEAAGELMLDSDGSKRDYSVAREVRSDLLGFCRALRIG